MTNGRVMSEGFYVTVRERADGGRTGYLLGPYDTHGDAEANVDRAHRKASEVNADAHWYWYGTAKVTADKLPPGKFNDSIGLTA